jgi:hypothetical protein
MDELGNCFNHFSILSSNAAPISAEDPETMSFRFNAIAAAPSELT